MHFLIFVGKIREYGNANSGFAQRIMVSAGWLITARRMQANMLESGPATGSITES